MFSTPKCFFCNTQVAAATKSGASSMKNLSFKCASCGCWNRYDDHGVILSSESAMYHEELNRKSFAKRASPSKDRLPTTFTKSPFCHSCTTNQMLLVNLLSNYLPEPDAPDYEFRLQTLPEYQDSLYRRYPICCDTCAALVDSEIKSKDSMARSKALGQWLQQSKGKEQQRRVSSTLREREKLSSELLMWRIRGALWFTSVAVAVIAYGTAAFGRPFPRYIASWCPFLPLILILSLFWTFWDPTYSSLRNFQIQGRQVRVNGKRTYLSLQFIVLALRIVTSLLVNAAKFWDVFSYRTSYFSLALIVELIVFGASFFVLQIRRPPTIRLLDTDPPRPRLTSPAPSAPEPDLLASLSLSQQPVLKMVQPVFGRPSLKGAIMQPPPRDDSDMDWTPTNAPPNQHTDDGSWIRPQRFFAPEKPTGLEDLFQKANLMEDVTMSDETVHHSTTWWAKIVAGFM